MPRIYLMGFMGSGKSYQLNAVSTAFALTPYDLDVYIEQKEQRSIGDIFQSEGEAFFRQKEHYYLTQLSSQDNFVLALGGGTPCSYPHISLLNQTGLTVFLDVEESLLWQRLRANKSQRPLIAHLSDEALRDVIRTKLAQRRIFYTQAKIHVKDAEDVVSKVKEYIQKPLASFF